MRFLELQIKGFGKFHDRTISFEDGMNVVYGKNETGKSTMHTFIRGMLFGIQPSRGRASKHDLYSKYEPWENSGTYEGALRLEHDGHIYRLERSFQKNKKEFRIIDETLGKELEPSKALLDDLLCGLSETAYNNTISIGQLKSATESGMISELKNYIANMNTSGNMALNITKATVFLKKQRKEFEAQLIPEAARSYTTLLGEIKALEREISSPEYENRLPAFQKLRSEARSQADTKQAEKEQLLQKAAKGRQILAQNQFTDIPAIEAYQSQTESLYQDYQTVSTTVAKKSRKVMTILPLLLAVLLTGGAAALGFGAVRRLERRVQELNQLWVGLSMIRRELGWQLTPLPELLRRAAGETKGAVSDFFRLCAVGAGRLNGRPFRQIWQQGLECVNLRLEEDDLEALEQLGGVLGRYDEEHQQKALEQALSRLEEQRRQAVDHRARLGRVYGMLGLTSGLFLVILLI